MWGSLIGQQPSRKVTTPWAQPAVALPNNITGYLALYPQWLELVEWVEEHPGPKVTESQFWATSPFWADFSPDPWTFGSDPSVFSLGLTKEDSEAGLSFCLLYSPSIRLRLSVQMRPLVFTSVYHKWLPLLTEWVIGQELVGYFFLFV